MAYGGQPLAAMKGEFLPILVKQPAGGSGWDANMNSCQFISRPTALVWGTNDTPGGPIPRCGFVMYPDHPLAANRVDFYNPMKIRWQYSSTNRLNFLDAGTSTNQVYVTLRAPTNSVTVYHTVAHLACANSGATTENQAVANTWSFFTGRNVTTWDGRALHYYQAGIPWATNTIDGQQNTEVYQLLRDGNGQCDSWRGLLEGAWSVNGIASTPASATSTTSSGFIVKNWVFGTATLSNAPPYDYYLELNEPYASMVPSTSGDVQSQTGLAGQNSPTPAEKVFGSHYFQLWNNLYYDPSYGVNYTDAADFQAKAIAGYVVLTDTRTPGKPAVAVKPVTSTTEVQIVP